MYGKSMFKSPSSSYDFELFSYNAQVQFGDLKK